MLASAPATRTGPRPTADRPQGERSSLSELSAPPAVVLGPGHPEACESGRIGTTGNRVWGNSPWVQIPPPPPYGYRRDRSPTCSDPRSGTSTGRLLDDGTAMGMALAEAASAVGHGDVPVGAVALVGGRVIAARHNERERRGDPTAHAELLALSDAAAALGHLAACRR